jgi:CARDB
MNTPQPELDQLLLGQTELLKTSLPWEKDVFNTDVTRLETPLAPLVATDQLETTPQSFWAADLNWPSTTGTNLLSNQPISPFGWPEVTGCQGVAPVGQLLSELLIQQTKEAAIAQWVAVGISEADRTVLESVQITVTDLPSQILGQVNGYQISIDNDAAGIGWFLDPTPGENSEFSQQLFTNSFKAEFGSSAYGLVDLFTVIEHELGHILGFEHSETNALLSSTLPVGERRLGDVKILELDRAGVPVIAQEELALPDLVVTDFKILTPNPTWGQSVDISWTVTNQGSAIANRDWYDHIWISADGIIDGNNDIFLGQYYTLDTLAAGASYTKTATINVPYDLSKVKLVVLTDTGAPYSASQNNRQAESDEANNSKTIESPFVKADLVVSDFKILDPNPTWGEAIRVSWTITNQGAAIANRDWYDHIWISADGIIDGINDTFLGQYYKSDTLAAGASYTKTATINGKDSGLLRNQ